MTRRLRVDPIACDGHGLCADLFPERIGLDEWGYPLLDHGRTSAALDDDELGHAHAAVTGCPTLALQFEHTPDRAGRYGPTARPVPAHPDTWPRR